jgi:uncharacterized membrane protein YhaH (DUF805 family)
MRTEQKTVDPIRRRSTLWYWIGAVSALVTVIGIVIQAEVVDANYLWVVRFVTSFAGLCTVASVGRAVAISRGDPDA